MYKFLLLFYVGKLIRVLIFIIQVQIDIKIEVADLLSNVTDLLSCIWRGHTLKKNMSLDNPITPVCLMVSENTDRQL